MIKMTKPCIICGTKIVKAPHATPTDWDRKVCCSVACSHKLRVQRMFPNGTKKRNSISQKAYERRKQSAAERLAEGKRAKVEAGREWDEDAIDTTSEAYQRQLAIDMAWRESISCRAGECKVYTPEEIAQIAHEITPIDKIKTTTKEAILFAEVDPTFTRRRGEEVGTLFARRD